MLRPYQSELIESVRQAFREHDSVVMVLPTGGGKTLSVAWMIKAASERGNRCIFTVHRRELLEQTVKTFQRMEIPHGVIASGEGYDTAPLVHIASIDTLRRRLDDVLEPAFIVVDEAHHSPSNSWSKVIRYWPNTKKLLITATPERLDGAGLKHLASFMTVGKSPRWLIDNGFLSDFVCYAPASPSLKGVKTTAGDYNIGQLAEAMDKSIITGNAIEHYRKLADGKQALVYCVNIEHSKHVCAEFSAAGYAAAHIDGGTPKLAREDIIERFRYGETRVLCNVNILTEGFDVPAAEVGILLRPTKSLALHLQMVGRVLRPADGKENAIILDHAGNSWRHGLPDEEHPWSLEGKKARPKKKPVVTICERCFFAWTPKVGKPKICPACGFQKEVEKRETEQVAGDLVVINPADEKWAWARRASLARVKAEAKTVADLHSIARVRGYKAGWAHYAGKELGIYR